MKKSTKGAHYCSACNRNSSKNPGISFFRFPKDENRCSLWRANVKNPNVDNDDSDYCYQHFRICSVHFEKNMFSSIQGNRLKRDAVPTIFDEEQRESSDENVASLTALENVEDPELFSQASLEEGHGDVDFIKSEPLDSLSETEAPINVSSNASSASNIGKMYCRLCLMPTYDFATPIGAVDSHYSDESQASSKNRLEEMQEIQKMIDICLPFYNPLTLNPVVCPTCVTHLKNSYNFAIQCLEKQQQIEEYINIYGTPEQVVNINDIIESKFLTSKVQDASYKRTDTTTTNVPNTSIKKNKGKRNISNKVVYKDVDSPLLKKQKIHEESRKVNIDQDKEIRIKVEPGEDDNSNAAAPARIPTRPNSKDSGEDLQTELDYKDSLDLIKTVLVSRMNVGEFENEG